MAMERRVLYAALTLLLFACVNPPARVEEPVRSEPPVRGPIATDRSAYTLRNGELTIVSTFTAPRTAYLTHCNGAQPLGLQRSVNGKWVNAWVAAINGCFSAPIELKPGQQHTATVTIRPGGGAVTYPFESGTYRVAWFGVLASYEPRKLPHNDELPLEQRVSAPFRIDVQPPLASTPPPPERDDTPMLTVSGEVVDAGGRRIAHADVLVRAADDLCRPTGASAGAITDENGQYVTNLLAPAGCVVAEARSGGASGTNTAQVSGDRVHAWVRLGRPDPLTPDEAERLVRLLAAAINEPARATTELHEYILHGPEALRVALEQYRTILGRVTDARNVSGFIFDLAGEHGRTSRVEVLQQEMTRMHSPLLDYGFRAQQFMNAYLRAISSGDAVRLSQVLNPDDVDFPVERAREMIVRYRQRYRSTAQLRAEFVDVDERRHTMRWRIRGENAQGEPLTEMIELGFGDGLIGMRGL
jgi:Carboxypeptidase regulatory-like domain